MSPFRHVSVASELQAAFDEGGSAFVLHFQPVVDLRTGTVPSVEALVRWVHDGQMLSPSEFLDDVRAANLMEALTALVLERSLQDLHDVGVRIPVSVNLPVEVLYDWILDEVRQACMLADTSPANLIVEIPEVALTGAVPGLQGLLARLRAAGTHIIVDDVLEADLDALSTLPIAGVKLQRSLTAGLATDDLNFRRVKSMAETGRSFDWYVVASGAEDHATVGRLQAAGVHGIQGYVYTHPMRAQALAEWLEAMDAAPAISH